MRAYLNTLAEPDSQRLFPVGHMGLVIHCLNLVCACLAAVRLISSTKATTALAMSKLKPVSFASAWFASRTADSDIKNRKTSQNIDLPEFSGPHDQIAGSFSNGQR